MRQVNSLVVTVILAAGAAEAEMVTARWGVQGRVQHPGALRLEPAEKGTLMAFDLSTLPRRAAVYRARLFFSGVNWRENGFDIVPAVKAGSKLRPAGKRLEPPAPWYQWLDATDAVRGWARAGAKQGLLLMRTRRAFDAPATFLEIAYEGKAADKLPPQTSQVKAFCRAGQVFITFNEIDPPDGARETLTWKDLLEKFRGNYYGPLPDHPGRRMTYQVYCHDRPITAANVGRARLLAELLPGSAVNTRMALPIKTPTGLRAIDAGRRGEAMGDPAKVTVVRAAVEPGKPVGPGTGLYVHTVDKAGAFYYAVLAAEEGVVNAKDISRANSVGPVRQAVARPEPVLYAEFRTQVGKVRFTQQWYSFWTVQPMSPVPFRYDVGMAFCPELLTKPAPMTILRGGWGKHPTPPRLWHPLKGFYLCHTADQPDGGDVDMRMGLHDSNYTLKGFDQGKWQPFLINRQTALAKWACKAWPIDRNRVNVHVGAWGSSDLRYGNLYAMISGWMAAEMTKGWSCWDRARAIWGTPQMYEGRADDENPYVYTNLIDWVLANPRAELPYVWCQVACGGHDTEIGWPPYPRFMWAMMQSKQPFVYCAASGVAVPEALKRGQIVIRRDRSTPAFANCSLDDNVGEGDRRSGDALGGQVNGWVMWDCESIEDTADRYAITLWIGPRCPLPEGALDMTPRRCQKFKPKPGAEFTWTNALLPARAAESPGGGQPKRATPPAAVAKKGPAKPPEGAAAKPAKVVRSGQAVADRYGLVTIEKLVVTKGKHRITIRRR